MDQRSLVEQAARGDHDAFAVLAGASIARLDAAARLILRDSDLAQDAVQDALMAAWRNLRALRDPDRFDAWVYRLLIHACIDVLRRRRSRPIEVEMKPVREPTVGDVEDEVADREIVDNALRRLDPTWRAVVILHYFLGMPLPEAAAILGIPLGTAKSRLHRSLALMRTALDGEGYSDVGTPVRGHVT